jgi:acyl-CoA synthetase
MEIFARVEQALMGSDRIVLETESRTLRGMEVLRCVEDVASVLMEHGWIAGCEVYNALEQSLAQTLLLLATWKLDGCHVPVRVERLAAMPPLDASPFIAVDVSTAFELPGYRRVDVLHPSPWSLLVPPRITSAARHAAYMVHTSGTTRSTDIGVPVCVPATTFLSNVDGLLARLGQVGRVLLVAPPTFDPSLVETVLPLVSGGVLVIVGRHYIVDPLALFSVLQSMDIQTLFMTPTAFLSFTQAQQHAILGGDISVRGLVLGGECFPEQLLEYTLACRVWNLYGTTECSVWASLHRVDREVDVLRGVPIGAFLQDVEHAISDTGELWLGGINRRCLVGDEVVPVDMRPTGDLVRTHGGRLYILGRVDDQIKRYGRRIHLNMVNAILQSLECVQSCCVVHSEGRLLAFVVPVDNQVPANQLHRECQHLMDEYAKPDEFILVSELPTTQHGKVDKKRLLATETVMDLFEQHGIVMVTGKEYFLNAGGSSVKAAAIVGHSRLSLPQQQQLLQTLLHEPLEKYVKLVATMTHKSPLTFPTSPAQTYVHKPLGHYLGSLGRVSDESLQGDWQLQYKIKLGQCVDATPLVCIYQHATVVAVGSHAGDLVAFHLKDGSMRWRLDNFGRIEASAAVSPCGQRIYVGSHNGTLYTVDMDQGTIVSTFVTGGVIKATPVATGDSVWIGSYDGYLYHLHWNQGLTLHTKYACGAAIYASVAIDGMDAYVAALDGRVHKLVDGVCMWIVSPSDGSYFSSPVVHNSHVLVCNTNGNIHSINSSGQVVWSLSFSDPILATPTCMPEYFVVGCYDSCIYWINYAGTVLDSLQCGKIFSSISLASNQIICASVDGTLMAGDWSTTLPGGIFSTPLLTNRTLVCACRDDHVYIFNRISIQYVIH